MDNARRVFILTTDIGRSTQLWDQFAQEFAAMLELHNQATEEVVAKYGGEVMKNLGDGYIALFPSAKSCAEAVVELQLKVAALPPLPDGSPLQLRVVGHGGTLQRLETGRGYFGAPLNRASRICAVCHPGQVLLSQAMRELLDTLPAGASVRNLGLHRLRDLAEPENLFQLDHPEFPVHEFPPPRSLDTRPNNLVIQPNAFVGREQELQDLASLFKEGATRLLTVIAPGGYGKSRLANQLGADLLSRFPQGVFEVRLAQITEPQRIPEAIATATGFQFYGSREPGQQILDYLREKDILLLFDNFEHVLPGASFITEILQTAQKARILATSREPLRITGERVYKLEPLPTGPDSESVQLFTDRASLAKQDFSLTAESARWVEQICARLEGVPLAIELAAAWADSFTLEEMYGELGQQLELVSRHTDVPERQRSVRASCDWSYKLLGPELRSALRRTSVFRGGFFIDAGEDVLELKGMALRKTLADLCDKSWLYTREIRWTVLGETTAKTRYFLRDAAAREYAWEKLLETKQGTTSSMG